MYKINHKSSAVLTIVSILSSFVDGFSAGCVEERREGDKDRASLPLTGEVFHGIRAQRGIEIARRDKFKRWS